MPLESIHELRRKSPWHHLARAENARLCAYSLWNAKAQFPADEAAAIGYTGTPATALSEGFRREASLALELNLKALIARRVELGIDPVLASEVPPTHDILQLWTKAGLTTFRLLPRQLKHTLLQAKITLLWAGRYAAPNRGQDEKNEALLRQAASLWPVVDQSGTLKISQPLLFGWQEFDEAFQIVAVALSTLIDQP